MGLKPSDCNCVPLCIDCHAEQGHHGEVKFWGRNLDKAKVIALNLWELWNEDSHERDRTALEMIERFR